AMAEPKVSDLLIIGAGPGGYAAAFLAADKGMSVTLVDAGERPGGTCLHVGCIPSKALLHAAKLITDSREAHTWGLKFTPPQIDLLALRKQEFAIIDTLGKNLAELCQRRKVEYLARRASFVDSRTVQLDDGSRRSFRYCILATGSLPARPAALALDHPRVMDSTAALRLDEVPGSLLVVGGGYIGLELGYVYAALGSQVTVVELTDGLLPGVDRDLVRPLQARLATLCHRIWLNTKVVRMEPAGAQVRVTLEGAEVSEQTPTYDRVLVAVGRRPNTEGLGLERTRVQLDARGFVCVDERRRTTEEHIYAIGDVAGEPMLAHKATFEAKVAVRAIAGEAAVFDAQAIPAVVFTDPEIAWCGLTETEAKRQQREVRVSRFPWAASGRALTLGRPEGLTKLIVDPDTERLLGVGIVGPGAGEMIAEGVLAIEMGATATDLALTIHPHPTLSETVAEAAEALHGTATHLYRPRR
ncbi:MAG: dihydrolipoyl dehydrogenase, partial [Gemmataceae bacterium]|nr:dihydrolipoyl dehydrogenase [Gemmataceae bacterium]MDW8266827.1 dihydrolipoyl dehydrogenase [Gemmataceae bacterium]